MTLWTGFGAFTLRPVGGDINAAAAKVVASEGVVTNPSEDPGGFTLRCLRTAAGDNSAAVADVFGQFVTDFTSAGKHGGVFGFAPRPMEDNIGATATALVLRVVSGGLFANKDFALRSSAGDTNAADVADVAQIFFVVASDRGFSDPGGFGQYFLRRIVGDISAAAVDVVACAVAAIASERVGVNSHGLRRFALQAVEGELDLILMGFRGFALAGNGGGLFPLVFAFT